MVKYFSKQMEEIVGDGVDLLFCNDEEAMTFTGTNTLTEAREKMKELNWIRRIPEIWEKITKG